jgi:L-alanine-DL-glutamate epimerase-like enolase superfamily enzyme
VRPDGIEAPRVIDPDPIREVTCFDCSVPLPRPLLVGDAVVDRRSYAVVRIRAESGLDGAAYAFARGLPVAAIVESSLAPLLIGADATEPESIRARLAGAYWPYAERGLFTVAASAIDLALWDILGQRAGLPLADLLGRLRRDVPVCAVGGYVREGISPLEGLQEEMSTFMQLGCTAVKVTVGAASPEVDASRLAAVREVVGDETLLVVDAFRTFRGLEDALHRLRLLEPYDLSYVEDPFSETAAPLVRDLRRRSGVSIGLGENLSGHPAFRDLLDSDAVDVVRCDATVAGGVRELMAATALASARALPVSMHVHANVHVHFGAALSNLHPAGLEYMPPDSGLDALETLLDEPLEVRDGRAVVPDQPGLGIVWNWDTVARFADG